MRAFVRALYAEYSVGKCVVMSRSSARSLIQKPVIAGDEDDALDTSAEDHCADDHKEDCGIDRMAHEGVRARANQFVTLLERDAGAPIAAERDARPECEH